MSNINGSTIAKHEMLECCRNYFVGNTAHLKVIHVFGRNYRSTNAAHWYTKNSFVHRIINQSLRLGDIAKCGSLRFYIADLSTHLYKLKQEQVNTNIFDTGITILYRGLRQSEAHLETLRNCVGYVIATKGFISRSRSKDIALIFAGAFHPQSPQSQALLIELYVDMKSSVVVAADISHLSDFPEELEVLFDIGTVFYVKTFKYISSDAIWLCQLEMVRNESQSIETLREIPTTERDSFSSTFSRHEAELERIMRRERQHKFEIHHDYRKTNLLWRDAPTTSWIATDWRDFARTIMHKALSGWQRNQDVYEFRKECKRAWRIYKKEGNSSLYEYKDGANILNTLGYTSLRRGHAKLATELLEQALEIRERLGSSPHDIVITLRNLALAYAGVNHLQGVFACFKRAIAIEEQTPSGSPWSASMTMRNYGLFFHSQRDYNHAFEYLSKAWALYLKCIELPTKTISAARTVLYRPSRES